MLTVPSVVTRSPEPAPVSDRSPQTFKESLHAVVTASSHQAASNDARTIPGRRQSPGWDDTNLPVPVLHLRAVPSRAQQTAQVSTDKQPPLINLTVIPIQLSTAQPVLSAEFSPTGAGLSLRRAASLTSSNIESTSITPSVPISAGSQGTHDKAETVTKTAAEMPSTALPYPPLNPISHTTDNVVVNADPSVVPETVKIALPNSVPGSIPSPVPSVVPSAAQSVSPRVVLVSGPIAGDFRSPTLATIPTAVPDLVRDATHNLNPVPGAVTKAAPSQISATAAKAFPSAVKDTIQKAAPDIAQDLAPTQSPHAIPVAAPNADPLPAPHSTSNSSARGELAQSSSPTSTGQGDPTPASDPIGSTLVTAPGATADQMVALTHSGGTLLTPAQASGISVAVAKPAASVGGVNNNAINDPAGVKQHAQPLDQAQSQAGSQDAASSSDQNQPVVSPQGQSAATVQTSFANHLATPLEHAPNGGMTAPLETSPALAAHTPKPQDNAAPAALPLPPALPVINTARLIQNMGQSEMRVGMRSPEFGNISISTSATRDLVSAQISLDHSELARTLAVHLPEMQTRLGNNNQAIDVRIDLNGQATGQGTGASDGMSNGSQDGSRGDRQQKGSVASAQTTHPSVGQVTSAATASAAIGEGRLNTRLDITA